MEENFTQAEPNNPDASISNIKEKKTKLKKSTSQISSVSSRYTRSQVAPNWTDKEMVTLVNEIFAVDRDKLRALPSYQKWKIISENCSGNNIMRSANLCHRKWEAMLSDYRKIVNWESEKGKGLYWSLSGELRLELGLSISFGKDVFELIDGLIGARNDSLESESDYDEDGLLGSIDLGIRKIEIDSASKKGPSVKKHRKNKDMEQVISQQLRETAQLIHSILDGNSFTENVHDKKPDSSPGDYVRKQGDELIKILGGLVQTLEQFTESVKTSS